jgi:hypothetical protein
MRHAVARALALAIVVAPSAAPATTAPAAVVMEQLEALARRDPRAAYELASTEFRRGHHALSLARMMAREHPEIATSVAALVVDQFERIDGWYVRLRVTGANGRTVEALYRLVREAGAWRVDSVVTRPVPDLI